MRPLVILALFAGSASADTHVMERGETLEHVARFYGCSTEALMKANNVKTTLVRAGVVVRIPTGNVKARARQRATSPEAKAEAALAVIDGASVVKTARAADVIEPAEETDGPTESVGQPWNGKLVNGERMPRGEGYQLRRPQRAFGASHVVEHLQHAIGEVRALYPDVHTLAIGDLSQRGGGKIGDHLSHQSGLDVDVGFYFTRVPDGYPDAFVAANSELDLQATWALLTSFIRTSDLETGVQMIFLDYDVQARLYKFAKQRGTPDEELAAIFQYPRGKDTLAGIVRHWPRHADHLHVRFKPAR